MNFQQPSPVQAAAIGPMLDGHDLMVQAPTGTGKTAAFGIPVVEHVQQGGRNIETVILCPTRELAVQTATVLKQLTFYKPGIRVLALYGGEPIQRQITALKRRPQIIVATPGRLMDHINRRTVRLDTVGCVVLDEADRMLDMGFREDMDLILRQITTAHQTVLFSATLSNEIRQIAGKYQTDAQIIRIRPTALTVKRVTQYYAEIPGNGKTPALLRLLTEKQFRLSLVFVATKVMADNLCKQLTTAGYAAAAIHGDLRQSQRDRVMARFRGGKVRVLVATDVAARGIDVDDIDAVVNYDIPGDADSYVHRIGRTGRADKSGEAYTFIYAKERGKLRGIMGTAKAQIAPVALGGTAAVKQDAALRMFPQEGKPVRRNSKKQWNRSRQKVRQGA